MGWIGFFDNGFNISRKKDFFGHFGPENFLRFPIYERKQWFWVSDFIYIFVNMRNAFGVRLFQVLFWGCLAMVGMQAIGQRTCGVHVVPVFKGRHVVPVADSPFVHFDKTDTIKITVFKCYLARVSYWYKGNKLFSDMDPAHLLNAAEDRTLRLSFRLPEKLIYDSLSFDIGLDSSIQTAGAQGGDLDPMKGMYWTWQSGYINCKLEGYSSRCRSSDHRFEFHLGGYRNHETAMARTGFAVNNKETVLMEIDLSKWLEGTDLAQGHHLMTPGSKAVKAMERLARCTSYKDR